MTENIIKKAYNAATHNFDAAVNASTPILCGCFHCKRIFKSDRIGSTDFIEEKSGGNTVVCPFCGIDSVIVESDDIKVTKELVLELNNYAFHEDDEFSDEVTICF
mgnify:FL=1